MKKPIYLLFFVPIAFTFVLLAFRIFYSQTFTYLFLTWNLFLAGIPFVIASYLPPTNKKLYLQFILFLSWLLFFPNTLYLITDLKHLKERPPVPFWFDIILLFSGVLNGMVLAYASLYKIENYLLSKFNVLKTNIILVFCFFLSSFGIYLGRFMRWNSWDIVIHPIDLINEIIQRFINPFDHLRTWSVTIILTAFFSIFYFIIKKLPLLIKAD